MARYIDAERLKKKKKYCFQTQFGAFPKHEHFLKLEDVFETPTADVEEITRCKDCVYCKYDGFDDVCTYHLRDLKTTKNDWCSHAEKGK